MAGVPLLIIVCLLAVMTGCVSPSGQHAQAVDSHSIRTPADREMPILLPQPETSRTLKAIAYNVHLLPRAALPLAGKRSAGRYRAEKIAEQIAGYDLIGLSEVFDATHRQTLVDQVQKQTHHSFHVAYGPSRSGRHLIGGGLLLLSRYPILESHTTTYRNATRFLTHGFQADGFAAKGALHVRILIDEQSGSELDCFLTHLESQSADVRSLQVEELCAFVAQHHQVQNPVLLLGDFNIASESTTNSGGEYQELLTKLNRLRDWRLVDSGRFLAAGPPGSSNAMATDGGERIDYIFASTSALAPAIELIPIRSQHIPFQDEQVPEGSLSDHLAVACEFQLVTPQVTVSRSAAQRTPHR